MQHFNPNSLPLGLLLPLLLLQLPGARGWLALSRISKPELLPTPGLTLGLQNRPSGRERASPCQNQLAFSCIQMRKIGKGDNLEGRSECHMGPRREPGPLSPAMPGQWTGRPCPDLGPCSPRASPASCAPQVTDSFTHVSQGKLEEVPGPS